MRTRETNVFSTSFLDLLSCGMAAVIVLCFIFAAKQTEDGDVEGDAVAVDVSCGEAALGVVLEVDPERYYVGDTRRPPSVVVTPWVTGESHYRLMIDRTVVTSVDTITIFPAEFPAGLIDPQKEATVTVTSFAGGRGSPQEHRVLPGKTLKIGLATLVGELQ